LDGVGLKVAASVEDIPGGDVVQENAIVFRDERGAAIDAFRFGVGRLMTRKNEVLRLALLTDECASRHCFKPQEKPRQLSGLSGAEEGGLEDLQVAAILLVDAA
jgi:hypothetical protein